MAKQKGVIKVVGALDDITFSKTKSGFMAGMKSQLNKSRIMSDAAFVRTRENMQEFGRAGKASKMLRKGLRTLIQQSRDKALTGRLLKKMMEVIKADATSIRGERNVVDGESEMLKGFEFNANARLEACLFAPFTATIDRATGNTNVDFPGFVPVQQIVWPEGATHFRIASGAAAIDFTLENFDNAFSETAIMPLDTNGTGAINQVNALPAASVHPLFLAVGLQFFQRVNGVDYPLKNGAFNALSVVEVSGV